MSQWVAINKTSHQDLGWKKQHDYFYASADTLAPVVVEELSSVIKDMPLVFVRDEQQQGFVLTAMQSLQPQLNVYVSGDGRWQGLYVPAFYRGMPFRLVDINKDGQFTLCVDLDSPLVHTHAEDDDAQLFNPAGQFSEDLTRLLEFLQQYEHQRQLTNSLVNQLEKHQLIQPWPIRFKESDDAEPINVDGLYRIDEAALQSLNAPALQELAASGALIVAFSQLLSQARMKELNHYYSLRSSQPTQLSAEPDLDELFGEKQEDIFRF